VPRPRRIARRLHGLPQTEYSQGRLHTRTDKTYDMASLAKQD
jgi:hypothetical protein